MRPFPRTGFAEFRANSSAFVLIASVGLAMSCVWGCATVVSSTPPPPPLAISVAVTPPGGTVVLGNTAPFTAAVKNSSDTGVTWSVNGMPGGNSIFGTIGTDGVYTAPADLPAATVVQVGATSHADAMKSAMAPVTIVSDVVMTLTSTAASVDLGMTQGFRSTISSSGHPDITVRWSVSGAACAAGCGTIDASGNYTAPQILPSPAAVTVAAQSVADPSKQASTVLSINSSFTLQLSAPSSVTAGNTATAVATLTPVRGSRLSTILTWTLSGPGCSGSTCGTLTVVTTQSSGGNSTVSSATYTAPGVAPSPNVITLTVTPQADPAKQAQATLAIQPGVGVSLSPSAATRAINHRVTLTAQIFGSANTNVTWSVNGVAGGDSNVGQICATGLNPCRTVTSGNVLQVDYLAPGTIPPGSGVTVQATSAADSTKSATAQISVINHVLVAVLPGSATLAPLAVQLFSATVLGADNQNVIWQIQGTACGAAGACGTVTANGTYTAPNQAPAPNGLQVVAVSSDDTSRSGAASVAIFTGANILTLRPASVYAGAADGFTLKAGGSGFAASVPGPGSVLLIGGTRRTTTCITTGECITPVTAADVAVPQSVSVQIQNPDGTRSNAVSLVVVAPNASDDSIALTDGAPAAAGKDIIVVEPTTAGVSIPGNNVDLNVAALGLFSRVSNTCTLGGNPIVLARPASGTVTADMCLFSQSGLDASMTYSVSGPGDVTVVSKQPAGLGIIHLTLQIPANAAAGARSLFIQNTNLDKTAASGVLVVN
jgi:hypothetical protein